MSSGYEEKYASLPAPGAPVPPHKSQRGLTPASEALTRSEAIKRYGICLLILAILLFTGWQVFLYILDTGLHP
jgi:hypothetical protein